MTEFSSNATPSAATSLTGVPISTYWSVTVAERRNTGSLVNSRTKLSKPIHLGGVKMLYRVNERYSEMSIGPMVSPKNPMSHGIMNA